MIRVFGSKKRIVRQLRTNFEVVQCSDLDNCPEDAELRLACLGESG